MNILVCGLGGVGSFVVKGVMECVEQDIINALKLDLNITIADNDTVELKQMRYQDYCEKDLGENKAKALAKRYPLLQAIPCRINSETQLRGFDLIVLCVDNEQTRKMVVEYCYKNEKEFLDLRATGRRVFAMPKTTLKDNLKFITEGDTGTYSCQEKDDLRTGRIQRGHRCCAEIGVQQILNILRGQNNRPVSLLV